MTPSADKDVVLIVDDAPANLAVLHDTLDGAGYTVRVATDGEAALDSAARWLPDLILLDAVMPGLDGFDTCLRLKADPHTHPVPVIFMTGLTDSEHVVRGFRCGGADYVTKPVRPEEVLARMGAHLRQARLMAQTRQAFDASGKALLALDGNGAMLWQTPLAEELLGSTPPEPLLDWFLRALRRLESGETVEEAQFRIEGQRLQCGLHRRTPQGQYLILLQMRDPVPEPERLMQACRITLREAEVLHWVALGKTNRDIGDILQLSPRTVNKHLEHVFAKLGVETRTAAAAMAINRVPMLQSQRG